MKKSQAIFLILLLTFSTLQAQLNNVDSYVNEMEIGNWTFTDCNIGTVRSTHDVLNEGKILYIVKMATWCGYCKDNIHANFNRDVITALKAKYPGKVEIWFLFDGPTDAAGAKAAAAECNIDINNIFIAVDNSDDDAKFMSWSTPATYIYDPVTKKQAYNSLEFEGSPSFARANLVIDQMCNSTFQMPINVAGDNILYRKPVTCSSERNPANKTHLPSYAVSGYRGVSWQSDLNKANGAWLMVDMQAVYNLGEVSFSVGTTMDSQKITFEIANAPTGPWKVIASSTSLSNNMTFPVSNATGRYLRLTNVIANPGFVLSTSLLRATGALLTNVNTLEAPKEVISLFPNPVSSFLTIQNNVENDGMIEVYNNNGSSVLQQTIQRNTTLNTSSYAAGIYFVNFNGKQAAKFIKK